MLAEIAKLERVYTKDELQKFRLDKDIDLLDQYEAVTGLLENIIETGMDSLTLAEDQYTLKEVLRVCPQNKIEVKDENYLVTAYFVLTEDDETIYQFFTDESIAILQNI